MRVTRESFTTLQMDCRHDRKEGTCVDTELFSRILPSIPPFESKAFTNYSPEFHSHPNTKIQNFNSRSIPEFHSQYPENTKIIRFHVPSIFFFPGSSRALSYLILS